MEEQTLKNSTKWSYALGNNGFFITMTLFTTYPLIFMTRCLGLAFPLAVQILTWTKVFDITGNILFTGTIVEKVKLPWGKYRSWFLVAPVIAGIAACLFFSPLLKNVAPQAVLPLGVFLMFLWNMASNVVMVCHGAMNTVLVHNQLERVSIFKLSNQLQALTGFIAGFFMMKIVFAVGGEQSVNLAGMQAIGIIYSFLYFILYFIFFINLRDFKDLAGGRRGKASIVDALKLLFTNAKTAALTFSGMFSYSAETFFRAVASYFFLYVLFSVKTLDVYNWLSVAGAFVGATLAMPLARKTSKKNAYIIGYLLMAAALAGAYFSAGSPYAALGFICIGIVGLNFARSVFLPMYSDVSDWTRYNTGGNVASYTMTLYNLCFKVAGFIAASASSLLALAGFKTGVDPAAEVSQGIRTVATLGPAAFAVAGALIMLVFYRLNEKDIPAIQAELKSRDITAAEQAKQAAQ
ncbi:MAG: MFS transporter [Treponema sp.]|jgi:Na+/melibiose symporter-like transporter|nr:MFS transporter [Treponema sp.]